MKFKSERGRKISHITYMWNLKINGTNEPILKQKQSQMQKTNLPRGKGERDKLGDWY